MEAESVYIAVINAILGGTTQAVPSRTTRRNLADTARIFIGNTIAVVVDPIAQFGARGHLVGANTIGSARSAQPLSGLAGPHIKRTRRSGITFNTHRLAPDPFVRHAIAVVVDPITQLRRSHLKRDTGSRNTTGQTLLNAVFAHRIGHTGGFESTAVNALVGQSITACTTQNTQTGAGAARPPKRPPPGKPGRRNN